MTSRTDVCGRASTAKIASIALSPERSNSCVTVTGERVGAPRMWRDCAWIASLLFAVGCSGSTGIRPCETVICDASAAGGADGAVGGTGGSVEDAGADDPSGGAPGGGVGGHAGGGAGS